MNDTERLNFDSVITDNNINELWESVFRNHDNLLHVNEYAPYPIETRDTLSSFLYRSINGPYQHGRFTAWFIRKREDNQIIGFVVHGDYFPGLPNNFGIVIGLPFTRNGYATEVLNELIRYRQQQGLEEIYGHCKSTNRGSIGMMLACGFQQVEVLDVNEGETRLKFIKDLL